MFYSQRTLYLFTGKNTIYYTTDVSKIGFMEWCKDVPCLVNTDGTDTPPSKLTDEKRLFILQATSPNPVNTKWTEKKNYVCQFVLNPPSKREIARVYVFYSLFLHL